jgi:hypothetical protein
LPKENPQPGTSHARKIQSTNSGDDEDRNPPKGNLENPHKLKVKIKRTSSQQEGDETHAQEDDLLLDNMDLDVDIENITFPDVEVSTRENVHLVSALMIHDETFSDEETFLVKNASFDKESKKLVFKEPQKVRASKLRSPPLTHRICYLQNYHPFIELHETPLMFQLHTWKKRTPS